MKLKQAYCESHPAIGIFRIDSITIGYVHGFQFGTDDHVMLSIVEKHGRKQNTKYYRRKLMYTAKGDPYFKLSTGRVYLNNCIRTSTPWT